MLAFTTYLAANYAGGGGGGGANSWSGCMTPEGVATLQCIPVVFSSLINWLLILAGTVALIFTIFAGISYITSKGDQKKLDSAKHTLTYAILGLLIIFLSFVIVRVISYITGVNCINFFGFTC